MAAIVQLVDQTQPSAEMTCDWHATHRIPPKCAAAFEEGREGDSVGGGGREGGREEVVRFATLNPREEEESEHARAAEAAAPREPDRKPREGP